MTPQEAELLLKSFGKSPLDTGEVAAQPLSSLPAQKETMQEAYRVYIADLIKRGVLSDLQREVLIAGYLFLEYFVDDARFERLHTIAQNMSGDDTAESDTDLEYGRFIKESDDNRFLAFKEITAYIQACEERAKGSNPTAS